MRLIGDPITVGGFPWLAGAVRAVATRGLTAKILCDRHNSALSGMDQVGIRLFEAIDPTRPEGVATTGTAGRQVSLFRGEMIELWMLKILCGLIVSENAVDRHGTKIGVPLPPVLLRILFGYEPMPPGWGMYLRSAVGITFTGEAPIRLLFIYDAGVLNGFILILHNLGFVLAANDPPSDRKGTLLETCTYRPGEIVLNNPAGQDILRIFWERPGEERSVTIERYVEDEEQRPVR